MDTRVLLDGWLDGALRSYGYMAGAETLKNFLRAAAEVAVSHVQEAAQAKGSPIRGKDPVAALQSMGKAEAALDIMPEGNIEVSGTSDKLDVTFVGCPYASVCSGMLTDLIQSNLPRTGLPCFRAEMCGAIVAGETGVRVRYLLDQFAPGDRCHVVMDVI